MFDSAKDYVISRGLFGVIDDHVDQKTNSKMSWLC